MVTTAQRFDLDVQAYLTWMFQRRGTRKRAFGLTAAQLTPAAYKQMLEQERCSAEARAVDMRETYAAGGRERLRGWLIGH